MNLKFNDWNIEEETGYKPITTAYADMSIAERFGASAVADTVDRLLKEWYGEESYRELTELVMALNWKIWEHYEGNRALAKVYNFLWEKARKHAETILSGDKLKYYYRTTD